MFEIGSTPPHRADPLLRQIYRPFYFRKERFPFRCRKFALDSAYIWIRSESIDDSLHAHLYCTVFVNNQLVSIHYDNFQGMEYWNSRVDCLAKL